MSTERKRPGPRPKQLQSAEIWGIPVGRDQTVVPPDQVQELAAIGCSDKEIAAFFDINSDTLRYNFASELEKGREYLKTRLRRNMFRAADNLNPAILIFLAKNILGMSDNPINTEASAPLPWIESDDRSDKGVGERIDPENIEPDDSGGM